MRGAWPVALLLLGSVAAALWAARPFQELGAIAPSGGPGAAASGAGFAALLVAAAIAVGAVLVWLARRDARRAVRAFMVAAIGFGLLLLLAPLVLRAGGSGALWWLAVGVAAALAWAARGRGWLAWSASALAAGGFAGLLAGVAGLAVLCVVAAAVAAYDAWAVRRRRMVAAADAADALGAPLSVGEPARFALGLGDLILPAALVAAAADPAHPGARVAALAAALGLAMGLVLLARRVGRHGDTPGTPYLCGGALAGIAAALLGQWAAS